MLSCMDFLTRMSTWNRLKVSLGLRQDKFVSCRNLFMALSRPHVSGTWSSRPNFWILGSLSPPMSIVCSLKVDSEFTALLVYVDDILLTGNSESALHADSALLPNPNKYRRLIGRLLYLGFTRPDISFDVQQLSQFLQAPRTSHLDAALHVLRYLKRTPSTGLFFSSASSSQLTAYSDASWAFVLILDALSQGIAFFWAPPSSLGRLKNRPRFPGLLRRLSIAAALHITANLVFHERTKHLDIDCHLVRDQFKLGFIAPSHVSGSAQLANLFTKSLPVGDFIRFLSKMGLFTHVPSERGAVVRYK
ncbi:UNVERIFIED_CONTAM: Retrovirus-related Pol polyprotein from transposon RE1 [Sesamum angustifolium]|uniref:Retrovirus-related Pol polyprotein from transposon RE1 n=1 Tax=Sesamum angustifolium TaxID=2727405 RepID=A0AAW2P0C1_9LAMI